MLPDFKKCHQCNEEKFISNYPKDEKSKDGYKNICKKCVGANSKARYEKRKANNETPLQLIAKLRAENDTLKSKARSNKLLVDGELQTKDGIIEQLENKVIILQNTINTQKATNIDQQKTIERTQTVYSDYKEKYSILENKYYKLKHRISLLYVATAKMKSRFGRIVIKKETLLNRLLDE